MSKCLLEYKEIAFREKRHGWVHRHTFTMFQGHGGSLPEGPTEWRTPHTSVYGRVRGL